MWGRCQLRTTFPLPIKFPLAAETCGSRWVASLVFKRKLTSIRRLIHSRAEALGSAALWLCVRLNSVIKLSVVYVAWNWNLLPVHTLRKCITELDVGIFKKNQQPKKMQETLSYNMCSPPIKDGNRHCDKEITGWTQLESGSKDRFYHGRILVALLLKLREKNQKKCD